MKKERFCTGAAFTTTNVESLFLQSSHALCTYISRPDHCTGPRFPRILRFLGSLLGSCLIVPQNLGILGNLGPVHESCTLFIRNLGNLGPVQVLFPSVIIKSSFLLQYLYGRKRLHFRNLIGDNVPNSVLARKNRSSQWT